MATIWSKIKTLMPAQPLSSRARTKDESHVCNCKPPNYGLSRARAVCGPWFVFGIVDCIENRDGARLSWLPISV